MKKIIYSLFTLILASVLSCGKMPDNGDLDGQWQLMEINTKTNPAEADYNDKLSKKSDRIYWCFHMDLMMVHETASTPLIYARFNMGNQEFNITKIYKGLRSEDSLITDPNSTLLEYIGLHGCAENFKLKELNSKRMVLNTPTKQLVLRKLQ